MRSFFGFCLLLFSYQGKAQKQLVVDPAAELRTIEGHYHSIKISSGINLYLSKSEAEAIAVSARDEEAKGRVKTEIRNGELHIYCSGGKIPYGKNSRINVYVGYKELGQLSASGSSDVIIAGVLETASLNLQVSGASELNGAIKVKELNIKLSGASDMKLTGTATTVNIESSGASDVNSFGLIAENCNVKVSGASDVNITVSKEIYASATGASDVHFKGTAEIKLKETHGSSTVARVD